MAAYAEPKGPLEVAIHRVTQGLLPAFAEEGKPAAMTLAERMAYWKVPGVSIAVVEGGQIAWARGFGVLKAGEAEAVTAETLFQAGSVSKPVAALGALRLIEAGQVGLDEDVNAKLSSWKIPENEFTRKEKVTLRRLLSHSAGVKVHGFGGYARGEAVPTLLQVLTGEKLPYSDKIGVNAEPGSLWRYSGGGYCIAEQLLMDLSKTSFDSYIGENVLSKLGMAHSGYAQPQAGAAVGHRADGAPLAWGWHVYPQLAAAGLWTTASDLCRFAIALQEAYAGKPGALISQGMAKQMMTVQSGESGLGLFLSGEGSHLKFSHGGANEGYQCLFAAYAETGQGAAVMCNGHEGIKLADEILRAIAHEYGWPDYQPKLIPAMKLVDLPPAELKALAGLYRSAGSAGEYLVVEAKDGNLEIQRPGWSYRLAPVEGGYFRGLGDFFEWEGRFKRGPDGAGEAYQETWGEPRQTGAEFSRVPAAASVPSDYQGEYRHPESGKLDSVTVRDGRAWYRPSAFDLGDLELRPIAPDEFFCQFAGVKFRRDDSNQVMGFEFDLRPGQGIAAQYFQRTSQ